MKVPKYIKEAVEKAAIYHMRANENNKKVRDWMEKNKIVVGEVSRTSHNEYVIDMFIDCVELSCRPTDFINFLKEYEE